MPEDKWDVGGSLSELSASKYLLLNSDKYRLTADSAVDTSGRTLRSGLNLSPQPEYDSLPSARLEAEGGLDKRPSATLSVGTKLLNFESRFEDVPPQQGGDALTNTVSANMGPFRAFYSEGTQSGNRDLEQTNIGGSWNVGPVELFARRNQSRHPLRPANRHIWGPWFVAHGPGYVIRWRKPPVWNGPVSAAH